MKYWILLIFPFCALAQHDFEAKDSKVIWQHVFKNSIDAQDMVSHITSVIPHENNPIINGETITGSTASAALISDRSGMAIAWRHQAWFNYRIDLKDDKYRVTVNNVQFQGTEISLYGVTDTPDNSFDTSLIRSRDGELRKNNQANMVMQRLHEALLEKFTYKAADKW